MRKVTFIMASATRGFDSVVFVEPLNERFTCPICHLAFREPVLTRCGHHFCSSCLTPCLQQSASCPVCRAELEASNTFPNNALKREILDLKIKCCLNEKGCAWTGELRNCEMHDRDCQYVDVVCVNGCKQLLMRGDMEDHTAHHCPQGMTPCKHCNLKIKRVKLEVHYRRCDKYPVVCTYNCGRMVQRCQMEDHISDQGTCPKRLFNCYFKDSGCPFRGNRCDIIKHIESKVVLHLSLIASELKETKQKLSATEHELAVTRDELKNTRGNLMDTTMKLSLVHIPQTQNQFLFTWRIDNWDSKVKLPKASKYVMPHIRSSQFCVYPGYHMYISAYPNGYDALSENYLSVFLFAVEGELDKKIKWPFPFSFDFELVDQQCGENNIRRQRSPPYGEALASSSCGNGCGFPKFASHEQLQSRFFIKDGSICIKLWVYVKNEDNHLTETFLNTFRC